MHLGQAGWPRGRLSGHVRAGGSRPLGRSPPGRPQDGTVHELAALKEVGTPHRTNSALSSTFRVAPEPVQESGWSVPA